MAQGPANSEVKAFVLLNEVEYLKENVSSVVRYFHAFRKEGVFSHEQCREIEASGAQMNKFVELISADQRGYDVFIKAVKELRVDAHVGTYLKKKVAEAAKLGTNGHAQLSEEQCHTLTLMKFMTCTRIGPSMARDILSKLSWDIPTALERVKNMGYDLHISDKSSTACRDISPNSSNCSLSDGGCSRARPLSPRPDESSINSTTGSSRESPGSDRSCHEDSPSRESQYADLPSEEYDHEALPPLPLQPRPSPPPPSSLTSRSPGAEYHPMLGRLPPLPPKHLPPSRSSSTPSINVTSGTRATTCSRTRGADNPLRDKIPLRSSSETKLEVNSYRKLIRDEDALQPEVVNGHTLGSFWSCYHCHQQNANALERCVRCKMLFSHTNESWGINTEGEGDNYVCVSCDMGVRLPHEPCPQVLMDELRHLKICNKCFSAKGSCFIDKGTQTESILACMPTMVLLHSMFDEEGKRICIIDEVASQWDALAHHLGIRDADIRILERNYPMNCQRACMKMLGLWINRRGENLTWECLVGAVKDVYGRVLAVKIEAICSYTLKNAL